MERFIKFSSEDFNAKQIFECGQCFRWNPVGENSYIGVANGQVLKVSQTGEDIIFENINQNEFDSLWNDYFDLKKDYKKAKKLLSDGGVMDEAISFGGGIRILKQDPWETLLSFIISSNNNIPRIKKIIETFCRLFGKPILAFSDTYYSFPEPSELFGIEKGDLAPLCAGYRDEYLIDAIKKITSGEINLDEIHDLDYVSLKSELMKIKGVGPKVADCIALFGFAKEEAFPVDVWVRRVLHTLYNKEYTAKEAAEFAKERFGKNAGIAQQYLFYYMRENASALNVQEG